MSNFKEIVTKAVIGKGKKTFSITNEQVPECNPTNILGCWVINHNFQGTKINERVEIDGSFDVNIWYSCENNKKTEVTRKTITYKQIVQMRTPTELTSDSEEIIIRSLRQPTATIVQIKEDKIVYTIDFELGIELVGDTKVRISIDEDIDDWEEIIEDKVAMAEETIDKEVNEDFI